MKIPDSLKNVEESFRRNPDFQNFSFVPLPPDQAPRKVFPVTDDGGVVIEPETETVYLIPR